MTTDYLLFVVLGFGASLISAVFGFGTALVMLAVGAHILPVKEAIALATVLFAASTLCKSILFARYVDWKLVGLMSVTSLPFAYFGAMMMVHIPADILSRFLGLMILCYLGLTWFGAAIRWKPQTTALLAGSAAYGFVSGLLGSGNFVKVSLFREISLSKEAFVGAMAATSVLANAVKLNVFTVSGLLHSELKMPMIGLVIAAGMSALLGRFFLSKLTIAQFEVGLRLLLGISAFGLMV